MAEDYDEKPPSIIIDNGSCCIKFWMYHQEYFCSRQERKQSRCKPWL